MWATPGLSGTVDLVDADKDGVTTTNLNRCPLFDQTSINRSKAHEGAGIAANCAITWQPHHARFEDLEITPLRVISAVDTNRAREAIQNQYPALILSASTSDLRAELLRVGPPGDGACLRCFNPPEAMIGDDTLRAQTIAGGPDVGREQHPCDIDRRQLDARRQSIFLGPRQVFLGPRWHFFVPDRPFRRARHSGARVERPKIRGEFA